jgi:alpha-mannosidase
MAPRGPRAMSLRTPGDRHLAGAFLGALRRLTALLFALLALAIVALQAAESNKPGELPKSALPDAAAPQRHWKVFVLHASHLDPGWMDMPAKILELQAGYLDQIVELCDRTKDLPPEERFVYNSEHSWPFDYYERTRPKEQFEKLMAVCRRGQIEVGAIYAGVHTDFCGHEELARLTSYAAALRQRYGIRVDSALLNDVSEGYTMGLPQVLARSGIRGIVFGPGGKANLRGIVPLLPRLWRWTTPDESSVLAAWTPGFWTYMRRYAGFEGISTIQQFEALAKEYPYDAFFRHNGAGDNAGVNDAMRQEIVSFRKQYPRMDVRMGRVDDFLGYIEANYGRQIPTFQGDNPNSWADGTVSMARETGVHRRNQVGVIEAEKLAVLDLATGGRNAYPANDIAAVYRDLFFYSDHTWGLDIGGQPNMDVDAPQYTTWRQHWDIKRRYPLHAQTLVSQMRQQFLANLSARVKTSGPAIVVWNLCSWPRSDVVRLDWDGQTPPGLIDAGSGRAVAWQQSTNEDGKAEMVFVAKNVPPLGYAVYHLQQRKTSPAAGGGLSAGQREIENEFYRVTVDPVTGCVISIHDKRLGKELVDAKAAWPMNQYIHAHVDKGYQGVGDTRAGTVDGDGIRHLPDHLSSVRTVPGSVSVALETEARLTGGPAPAAIRRRVTLYRGLKFIEFQNVVNKKAASSKEQIYFSFPFALAGKVTTRVELPYAMMRWDRDILPGCWRGYSSIQHWADVSGEDFGITFSPMEAPVVSIGGINSNQMDPAWHKAYVPTNGHIFSYVMDNIWNCNYPLWQGGPVAFSYRVTSYRGACHIADAARFGWAHASPLLACRVGRQAGSLPGKSFQAVTLDADNVMLTALKRAEDGQGWIMRLYETAQQPSTQATLKINFIQPKSVRLVNLAEEDLAEVKYFGNKVKLALKANELVTLRVN